MITVNFIYAISLAALLVVLLFVGFVVKVYSIMVKKNKQIKKQQKDISIQEEVITIQKEIIEHQAANFPKIHDN